MPRDLAGTDGVADLWNKIFIPTLRFIKMRATRSRDALKRYEVHNKNSLRDGDAA